MSDSCDERPAFAPIPPLEPGVWSDGFEPPPYMEGWMVMCVSCENCIELDHGRHPKFCHWSEFLCRLFPRIPGDADEPGFAECFTFNQRQQCPRYREK